MVRGNQRCAMRDARPAPEARVNSRGGAALRVRALDRECFAAV